jgi:squalene synthase HpnC
VEQPLHLLAQSHYENFPVGSYLLPRQIRGPIRLIYAFARVADDLADEGDETKETRLLRLNQWEWELRSAIAGGDGSSFFRELAKAISLHSVPASLFSDLIEAFRMDARGTTYDTFERVEFYCRHSANPVGRILLHLFDSATEELCRYSDAICTALQLTNFWQDLSVDIERKRVYIPREDLERFGLTLDDLRHKAGTGAISPLLRFQVDRTRKFFDEGMPLLRLIDKRFALELRLTVNGGMRILDKIAAQNYDTLRRRPSLSAFDRVVLFVRSFLVR